MLHSNTWMIRWYQKAKTIYLEKDLKIMENRLVHKISLFLQRLQVNKDLNTYGNYT